VSRAEPAVALVGAGPTGALLSILLRRRGYRVVVYDGRPDPRRHPQESGRSINLALAARGIRALERVGIYARLRDAMVPMHGRFVHGSDEMLRAISRAELGRALIEIADGEYGVDLRFEHRLEGADFCTGLASIRDLRTATRVEVPMRPLIACDGAGSAMRRCLRDARLLESRQVELDHGYKELSIPAGAHGAPLPGREALHIWPRGGHMLIALPNTDGSFTATLFLPRRGSPSFESLSDDGAIAQFFETDFADVTGCMPRLAAEFRDRPVGSLGTVWAAPWHHRDMVALVGDSAHAIVPFHGQGMNCCFEDCLAFDECVARHGDWEARFAAFFALRKPNTDAIAAMSLDNYAEMRAKVADPGFRLQNELAHELERRLPERFVPRYSMVMFHDEIPYALAERRGRIQASLLAELTAGAARLADIDLDGARRAVEKRLTPIAQDLSSVTNV